MEKGLYAQVAILRRKDSDEKKEKEKKKIIISEVNPQNQYAGLILIMGG